MAMYPTSSNPGTLFLTCLNLFDDPALDVMQPTKTNTDWPIYSVHT